MDAQKHYDAEYEGDNYKAAYEVLPAWAQAMNRWHVDFVVALLGLSPERGPILDLGSGMGHYLSAWESRGFTTIGREISEVAIRKCGRDNIDLGDATDLSRYKHGQFQLVFSAAFLEHVTDEQVSALVHDELRVARYAAHFIAHDKGNDEGHINIKTPQEWFRFFNANFGGRFITITNPLCPVQPAFLHMMELPLQIEHAVQMYGDRQ